PALHARCRDGDPIDAATFDGYITADLFKALATKNLAGTRDMLRAGKAVIVGDSIFDKRGASNPKPRIGSQIVEQEFKIVGTKRNICIEVRYHVEWHSPGLHISGIEALHFRAK